MSEIEDENSLSIEDFIKELEAKEKDLQISSDLAIEIDGADFDDTNPEFIKAEFAIEPVKIPETHPPTGNFAPNNKTSSEFDAEVLQFKKQVVKLETERAELAETARRRQLDFDNYKKRIERERGETYLGQISNLATQMLPVLDNLNRALDFASSHSEGRSQDFHQFFEGIFLVNQQLNEVLAEMGVQPIASVGESFDPHFHEAVATETSGEFPPNTVTGELLRGYRIGDKIIRAAMVKVSTSASPARPNPPDFSPADNQNSAVENILETE
ncbi:MAG TPA: nucleotide exchange factor GrpE [Pyrinomonadaceae bacterium]|nr:nucleotide exchange factor GrpE [Pyrinomonadaceae bacterium]